MDDRWQTHRLFLEPGGSAEPLLNAEWTLTNGTGAYAMGTVAGCNTRRYHGLLVAATRPPVGRVVALGQMWEQLVLTSASGGDAEQTLEFSTLAFRSLDSGQRVFAPRGWEMLRQFDRGLAVTWQYQWGAIGFERRVMLHWKEQAVTIRYAVTGLEDADLRATLRLHPMLPMRDYHGLRHRAGSQLETLDVRGEYLTVSDAFFADHAVTFGSSHGTFQPRPHWWERVYYPADAERGQEDQEDYFVPAFVESEVSDGAEMAITAALGAAPVEPLVDCDDRARHLDRVAERLEATLEGAGGPTVRHSRLPTALAIAADDFVVDRSIHGARLSTIVAGYPWFSDWGRDTFIALPGLLLCTGRFDEARATLRTFGDAIFDGLVPNRFDDYDDRAAHYNTVDASLWYVLAATEYVRASGDRESWRDWLAAACLRVVDAYIGGTRYGIVMDVDGLIAAGDPASQLTWMDAKIGDHAFTPRFGKAVEINALWHEVLAGLAELLPEEFAEARQTCAKLVDRVKRSFGKVFWSAEGGCLLDTVWLDGGGELRWDASIRPNQVFAVSLPHSPLPPTKQKQVLATVRDHLLTPVGLRTLPVGDPSYHGRYTGDQWRRDEAYHQGTVWAWLIGPYAEAVLRVGKFSRKAQQEARAAINPLIHQLIGEGAPVSLGQLHEIYEADVSDWIPRGHPTGGHRPVGAVAQAWSVAELIRVLCLCQRGA